MKVFLVQTVFVVLDKWGTAFNRVFSTREKAEAYIEVRDKEIQRLMDGGYPGSFTSQVTANLIIEETEIDLVEEYPDDKPPLP